MNNTKSIAIVIKSSPYTDQSAQEALDVALAAGSFEQQVKLFFIADGVFHLLPNHQPDLIAAKPYFDTFKALEFYDVEELYCCEESLKQRLPTPIISPFDVELSSHTDISAMIAQQDIILTF